MDWWLVLLICLLYLFILPFGIFYLITRIGKPAIKNLVDDCSTASESCKKQCCTNCRNACSGCSYCDDDEE